MSPICRVCLWMGLVVASNGFLAPTADDKDKATLDRAQAQQAFEYLNKVRKLPAQFSKEIGIDLSLKAFLTTSHEVHVANPH